MFLEKYKPKNSEDIIGQKEIINSLNHFLKRWKRGKLVMIHGPSGVGKTSIVKSIANENNLDIFEINPENQFSSLELLKIAVKQPPLFKKSRIILFDDIDNFDSETLKHIILICKESVFPVIFTATDPYDIKLRELRRSSNLLRLKRIPSRIVEAKLKEINRKEKLGINEGALKEIARNSSGDLRSAINDLEVLSFNKKLSIDIRERETEVFETLKMFFRSRNLKDSLRILDSSNREIDELFWWIENNIPNEFKNAREIAKAYDILSRADIFRNSVIFNQNYRFKKYMKDLIAGIPLVKERSYHSFTFYKPPDRMVLLGMNKRIKNEENLKELAGSLHCSTKKAREQLPFIKMFMGM